MLSRSVMSLEVFVSWIVGQKLSRKVGLCASLSPLPLPSLSFCSLSPSPFCFCLSLFLIYFYVYIHLTPTLPPPLFFQPPSLSPSWPIATVFSTSVGLMRIRSSSLLLEIKLPLFGMPKQRLPLSSSLDTLAVSSLLVVTLITQVGVSLLFCVSYCSWMISWYPRPTLSSLPLPSPMFYPISLLTLTPSSSSSSYPDIYATASRDGSVHLYDVRVASCRGGFDVNLNASTVRPCLKIERAHDNDTITKTKRSRRASPPKGVTCVLFANSGWDLFSAGASDGYVLYIYIYVHFSRSLCIYLYFSTTFHPPSISLCLSLLTYPISHTFLCS